MFSNYSDGVIAAGRLPLPLMKIAVAAATLAGGREKACTMVATNSRMCVWGRAVVLLGIEDMVSRKATWTPLDSR